MTTSRKEQLQRLRSKPDDEIDFGDIPELGDDFWQNAQIVVSSNKKSITLRVDEDVLQWFRSKGKGYQTLMNAVLRSYAKHHNFSDDK